MHEIDNIEWNEYMEIMEARTAKEKRDMIAEQKKNAGDLLKRFGI